MSRIESFIGIGNGIIYIPYLNYHDFMITKFISKKFYKLYEYGNQFIKFYGYDFPIENELSVLIHMHSSKKYTNIFYNLFYKNYKDLEISLQNKEDIKIFYKYYNINGNHEYILGNDFYGSVLYNYLWNDMCLMELAYMLEDDKAIELLKKYKRYDCHFIKSFSRKYGNTSIKLLSEYRNNKIKDKILENRLILYPYYNF